MAKNGIFSEAREGELGGKVFGFISGAIFVALWIACAGGILYGLVRFVKWAWE